MYLNEENFILNNNFIKYFINLKSRKVFEFFFEISKIPRESGNETKISEYLVNFALKRNFFYFVDKSNNTVIKKRATGDLKESPEIVLQSHADMVCVKKDNFDHNFLTDEIKIKINGDFLISNNTTLGADNGIGVAIMLAILDSKNISHPKLECIFTAQEEVSMIGARNFDMSLINGQTFINLDGTDNYIGCGCVGTSIISLSKKYNLIKNNFNSLYILKINGLYGGHSAVDIDKNRANAIILTADLLSELLEKKDFLIIDINSGLKENVIPSSCSIKITFDKKDYLDIYKIISDFKNKIKKSYVDSESINITVSEIDTKTENYGIDKKYLNDILKLIFILPNGVINNNLISGKIGKYDSSNIAVFETDPKNKKISINCMMRSSNKYYHDFNLNKFRIISDVLGFKIDILSETPIWEPNDNKSKLLNCAKKIYREIYNQKAKIRFSSGALESCFFKTINNLEIISIGPNIIDMHSINEKVSIKSIEKFYLFLIGILDNLT
ncbi:MAG: beta-Ala-His dipeptidase [Clostridiales bacterium]|jgi:dipeptidase D|nr:beta-Ala-His dipeptidase [Clostridiales bacterium]